MSTNVTLLTCFKETSSVRRYYGHNLRTVSQLRKMTKVRLRVSVQITQNALSFRLVDLDTPRNTQQRVIPKAIYKYLPTGLVSKKYIVAPRSFSNIWLCNFCDADTATYKNIPEPANANRKDPKTSAQ